MLRRAALGAVLLATAALISPSLAGAQAKLQYEKYTLPNGLTVVLHEDHSLPVAAVDLWYRVGSKDEPARRSGFAHLFEHLMFMGTARVPNGRFDSIMEAAGGQNNASTAEDRTEFHESGPSNLLPTFLWLEADRLETLGRDIDQKKLDLQRDVVKNERRQNTENTPYGSAYEAINGLMFPPAHPYGHSVIGSMTDLDNASVGDVKDFFATYYVPNNAVLAVVGDFKHAEAKAQIARLFGTLPRRDDPIRPPFAEPDFLGKRLTMVDRVPQSKVLMVWHSPDRYAKGYAEMDLVASALGDGVSSRLYRRLVEQDKLATDVSVSQEGRVLGSLFYVDATAAEGADLDRLEAAIDDELAKIEKAGPTKEELQRAVAQREVRAAGATQSVESLATDLTEFEFYLGTPDGYPKVQADLRAVTPESAREVAKDELGRPRLLLRVVPQADAAGGKDPRDVQPAIPSASTFALPTPQEFTLSNGLKVHYYPRPNVPLVSMALLARHGAAEEPLGKAGETSLMADLLADGAGGRDAATFESDLERLGASFDASATARTTIAAMTVLERNLDAALPLYADALERPRFEADAIDREKRVRLAALQEETSNPARVAAKVAREAYFGASSPLGRPVAGTAATVPTLTKADVEEAYRRSLGPEASDLFVAGGVPVEALKGALEKNLGAWKAAAAPAPLAPYPAVAAKPLRVLIVDRPGAVQTNVRFLFPAPPLGDANRAAVEAATTALGGSFTSRLNQNLRESKGYTYGASARYSALPGVGYLSVGADVRSDATGPALVEFLKEFTRLRGGDLTGGEIAKSAQLRRAEAIQSLATLGGLLGEAQTYSTQGEPLAQLDKDLAALTALNAGGVNANAKLALQSDQGVLVLVGDRATIDKALAQAGLPKGEAVKGG